MKIAILIILLALFVFGILPVIIMSYFLYRVLLVRTYPEKWDIECSRIADEESTKMYDIGKRWEEDNTEFKNEVSIVSKGFHLFGEYFDFGFDKAVIIIPGRMESHSYSYFFALPYKDIGCNVLVIDNRAHGKSEGKRSCVGYREQYDIIAWARFLEENFNIKHIILHGICIGGATAVFAMTNKKKPECIDCLITEGMYTSFYHSVVSHMLHDNHPVFPFAIVTMAWLGLFSRGRPITDGPEKRVENLTSPALFIHSREDQYSLPQASEKMYEKCKSYHITKWFDKGKHSRIKINNLNEYDAEIKLFINSVYNDNLSVI